MESLWAWLPAFEQHRSGVPEGFQGVAGLSHISLQGHTVSLRLLLLRFALSFSLTTFRRRRGCMWNKGISLGLASSHTWRELWGVT